MGCKKKLWRCRKQFFCLLGLVNQNWRSIKNYGYIKIEFFWWGYQSGINSFKWHFYVFLITLKWNQRNLLGYKVIMYYDVSYHNMEKTEMEEQASVSNSRLLVLNIAIWSSTSFRILDELVFIYVLTDMSVRRAG